MMVSAVQNTERIKQQLQQILTEHLGEALCSTLSRLCMVAI